MSFYKYFFFLILPNNSALQKYIYPLNLTFSHVTIIIVDVV